MTRQLLRRVLVSLVAVAGTGCSAAHVFEPVSPPLSRADSTTLCEEMNAARPNVSSFRSLSESTVSARGESLSFRYAIAGRQPDSLRIDLLPNEGAFTLGMLVVHGGEVQAINVQEKTVERSPNAAAATERFLGLSGITPELVQALVTGIPPVLACNDTRAYEEGRGDVTFLDNSARVAYTVSSGTPQVKKFAILSADDNSVVAEGSLYYTSSNSPASMSLMVHEPHEATGVFLFKKITLNPIIADEIFEVQVPEDYSQVE